ncbi:MAG TPA: transcriptional regulator [Chloroflexi bacterium]|jgi:transcriptional regulator|nr:transcriptional regulator [Chloroflexota bacterium]HAL28257.1 transcriptional regulator [Chloroflexota bacterium]
MLIKKHDAAISEDEWKSFLASCDFGELIASGRGRDVPIVVPTHFIYDGDRIIRLHLAAPNPVWGALAENPLALVSVYGDYSYIPTHWNANQGAPIEYGVPTSYYAAVQAIVRTRTVDDPEELAAILRGQLAHFQPEGGHAPVEPDNDYGKLFGSIRGIVCTIEDVRAKFKYGGNKTVEHRLRIADRLGERDRGHDAAARAQLLRRTER